MRHSIKIGLALLTALALAYTGCNALEDLDEIESNANAAALEDASEACMDYCEEAAENCTGANVLYNGDTDCLKTCAGFPTNGQDNDLGGNSVQCRLSHLELAAATNPAVHCVHASASGGGICAGTTPCQDYCGDFIESCNPSTRDFANPQDCIEECGNFPQNIPGMPLQRDTVQCRIAWLTGPPDSAQCIEAGLDGCTPPPMRN